MDVVQFVNYLSIPGMLIIFYVLARLMKRDLILYFIICVSVLWTLLSNLYIENGIFITEQQEYSQLTGATFRYFIYMGIYLLSAGIGRFLLNNFAFTVNHCCTRLESLSINYVRVSLFIVTSIILVLLIHLFISGTVFTNSLVTRFNFWSSYAKLPFLRYINDLLPNIIIFLGVLLSRESCPTAIVIGNLVGISLYYFLLGNKFTPFYAMTWLLLIPLVVTNNTKVNSYVRKYGIYFVVFIVFIMSLGFTKYLEANDEAAGEFILYRALGLQGHLWWGIDREIFQLGKVDFNHIDVEVNEFIRPTADHTDVGHRYLMLRIGGETASVFIKDGVNFAGGFPSIVLYSAGPYYAIPIIIFIGLLHALVNQGFKVLIMTGDIVNIIVASRIFMGYLDLILMGETIAIFNYKTIVYLLFLLFYNYGWYVLKQIFTQEKQSSFTVKLENNKQ